jgi:hypothetical protein
MATAAGCMPILLNLISSGTAEQKESGLETFAKLVDGHHDNKMAFILAGGIEALANMVKFGHRQQKELAMSLVCRLVVENREIQNLLAEHGFVPLLLQQAASGTPPQKTAAAQALGELCAGNSSNQELVAKAGGIPALVELGRSGSSEERCAAAYTLGTVADRNVKHQQQVSSMDGMPWMLELAQNGSPSQKNTASLAIMRVKCTALPDSSPKRVRKKPVVGPSYSDNFLSHAGTTALSVSRTSSAGGQSRNAWQVWADDFQESEDPRPSTTLARGRNRVIVSDHSIIRTPQRGQRLLMGSGSSPM